MELDTTLHQSFKIKNSEDIDRINEILTKDALSFIFTLESKFRDHRKKILNKRKTAYKWPRLNELAPKLGIEFDESKLHDSRYDVEITTQCFLELISIGLIGLI